MPSVSEKQRKFMGWQLAQVRAGKKSKTGMNESQLAEFAEKPLGKKKMMKKNPAKPYGKDGCFKATGKMGVFNG